MTNGNDSINAIVYPAFTYADGSYEPASSTNGLTKREYFAAMRREPIFNTDWAKAIMGSDIPDFTTDPMGNINWWITYHERFAVMQADTLIAELNKQQTT